MKNLKNKGISLISLTVAVCILIVVSAMLLYNAKNGVKIRQLKMMQNDIKLLDDTVNSYYTKYGALPAEIEYLRGIKFDPQANDNDKYYVIDLNALEGITLNYGLDYNKIVLDPSILDPSNTVSYDDVYIINERSHHIYYARGIDMDGVMYYTNEEDEEINLQSISRVDITVENLTYEKIGTEYKITLENVKYNKSYSVSYKEANDSSYTKEGTNIRENYYTFNVDKYGLYYIEIEDKAGKTKQLITSIYADATTSKDEGENLKMVKSISGSNIVTEEVHLPKGFTISGVDSECAQTLLGVNSANEKKYTIDDGVVMYLIDDGSTVDWNDTTAVGTAQTKYDQFVWVPVPNAVLDLSEDTTGILSSEDSIKAAVQSEIDSGRYPMAIKNADGDYFGVLYQFSLDSTTNAVKVEPLISDTNGYTWTPLTTSGNREPSAVTNYDTSSYLPQVNGILNTSYSDSTSFGNALQTEFNAMVNKVANNEGFWVGRYETSEMSNTTTETYASSNEIKVNVVKGTTDGIRSVTWYRMYAQQKLYSKKANITATSSMIWGNQWDQIMIWMKNVDNISQSSKYVVNSVGMGNFGTISGVDDGYSDRSNPATTGCFKVKNVYDLAGNVYDWSLEAGSTTFRVLRRRRLRLY